MEVEEFDTSSRGKFSEGGLIAEKFSVTLICLYCSNEKQIIVVLSSLAP
jgi:hypothetical protein